MLLQDTEFLPQQAAPVGSVPILLWGHSGISWHLHSSISSAWPHMGPEHGWESGIPQLPPAAVPSTPPGKRGFDESHFRRKSWGLGAGQQRFPPSWHLPGGELLPSQHSQAESHSVPACPWDTHLIQGFPRAWHGHSAVPKPFPKQWPVMASCDESVQAQHGAVSPSPHPCWVCQLPL